MTLCAAAGGALVSDAPPERETPCRRGLVPTAKREEGLPLPARPPAALAKRPPPLLISRRPRNADEIPRKLSPTPRAHSPRTPRETRYRKVRVPIPSGFAPPCVPAL